MPGPDRATGDGRARPRPAHLVPEHLDDLAERALVVDPLAEEPRDDDGDHQRPRDGEEVEPDADPALHEHNQDHYHEADAVAHVPGTPGEGGARGPEPDGVDAVHLVVGTDEHGGQPVISLARNVPISGPLPETAMPSAMRPDDQTHAAARDTGVVAASADPQQDDRDAQQDERDDVVLDPTLETARVEILGEHERRLQQGVRCGHDCSSSSCPRPAPVQRASDDPGTGGRHLHRTYPGHRVAAR